MKINIVKVHKSSLTGLIQNSNKRKIPIFKYFNSKISATSGVRGWGVERCKEVLTKHPP